MALRRKSPRALQLVPKAAPALEFTPESQRVLDASARDVARELGRQAAREQFEMAIRSKTKAS